MIQFSSGLLDTFSHNLSSLTECNFIDMSSYDSQSGHWIQNYLLNSVFRGRYPDRYHQIVMALIRRAEAAFQEYELARTALEAYVNGPREAISKYFSSLYHFEQFIAHAYQAYMLSKPLLANPRTFQNGDNSVLERLNKIYNHIKHCDSKLLAGNFPENATVSIWLSSQEIHCLDANLTSDEIVEALKEIADYANSFSDPATVLKEILAENA